MVKRFLKRLFLALLVLGFVVLSDDVLHLNPAQRAAAPYLYSLLQFEVSNLLSKWVHRVASSLPWNSQPDEARRQLVDRYFGLGQEVTRLEAELGRAAAQSVIPLSELMTLESQIDRIMASRNQIRNDVEEYLESVVSAVLAEEGLSSWGGFIFPPVDFRLSAPPNVLVTSPRDRIERTHEALLVNEVSVEERESVEDSLFQEEDLSALIVEVGGIATYPASIFNNQTPRWTLQIAAHEWLHHYFAFRSLGWNMFDSGEMQTLNETTADIAGREIGDRAFQLLGGTIEPEPPLPDRPLENMLDMPIDGFDFNREMRATRLRVDELLEAGKVSEAEAYMEERRKVFVENGFHIRKLNQAYFAFHGTYAESPTSISPIGRQLNRFRDLVPDVGTFIRDMSRISSYQQFLDTLAELSEESPQTASQGP